MPNLMDEFKAYLEHATPEEVVDRMLESKGDVDSEGSDPKYKDWLSLYASYDGDPNYVVIRVNSKVVTVSPSHGDEEIDVPFAKFVKENPEFLDERRSDELGDNELRKTEEVNREPIDDKLNVLFDKLVPGQGAAETYEGEMVRAITRVIYRYFNDGDEYGRGYGKETVNSSVDWLRNYGSPEIKAAAEAVAHQKSGGYEGAIYKLASAIITHIEAQGEEYKPNNMGDSREDGVGVDREEDDLEESLDPVSNIVNWMDVQGNWPVDDGKDREAFMDELMELGTDPDNTDLYDQLSTAPKEFVAKWAEKADSYLSQVERAPGGWKMKKQRYENDPDFRSGEGSVGSHQNREDHGALESLDLNASTSSIVNWLLEDSGIPQEPDFDMISSTIGIPASEVEELWVTKRLFAEDRPEDETEAEYGRGLAQHYLDTLSRYPRLKDFGFSSDDVEADIGDGDPCLPRG